jgi:hypothetical protein
LQIAVGDCQPMRLKHTDLSIESYHWVSRQSSVLSRSVTDN